MARKLDISVWMGGRSLSLWCYESVPAGVRPAAARDLWPGRPVLYQVRIGPDAGKYYQDYVRSTTREILLQLLSGGVPVYVKEESA